MCKAVEKQVIQTKVDEYLTQSEVFTSVDIANAIKKDGTWIRNREVARWLRENFSEHDLFAANNYEKDMIDVGGGYQAFLYFPDYFDPNNYNGQNQKAMNPDDFQALHPSASTVAVTGNVPVDDDSDEEQDFNEDSRTVAVSKGRIWVPTSIISQLGMDTPGEDVDNVKLGLSGDPKLIIHDDGRVSISSKDVNSGFFVNGDKIVISIKNNKAIFEEG